MDLTAVNDLSSQRILLIGVSGQLGRALATQFSVGTLVAASNQHAQPGELRIDLGDLAATESVLRTVRPDLILIAGAMCNVDQCEIEPDACERINLRGPAIVAEYAAGHGANIVFFSTDHVFDGEREQYVESDAVNPLNQYVRSKARAETLVRTLLPDRHLILRTGWVYGPDRQRRNFALRLVDRITRGETVVVPSDQWGCPTYTEDLAFATRYLVERGAIGTYHATGPELIDRGNLAYRICEEFGLDRRAVILRPTRELGQTARRSLRVQLDCRKLHAAGVPPFRRVAEGLRALAGSPDTAVAAFREG